MCVWGGCGCGCVHACMNHTHMCIHLCVSVQSSCKHMWRPEIDIAMPSSITSPSITFQLFYLLFLLSLTIIQCIWCMCVSVGTQVLCGGQRTTSRSLLSFHREFQGSNSAFLEFVAGSLMHRVTPLALLLIF